MKIPAQPKLSFSPASTKAREGAVAVIVMLTLLAIVLMYIGANARTLHHLGRDLKLIERQQLQRWSKPMPKTNSVPNVATPPPSAQGSSAH